MQYKKILLGVGSMLFAATAYAEWVPIQLDRFSHGELIQGQALGPATTKAVNFHHSEGRLVAFDTRQRGTRDPDIEGPNGEDGAWTTGNLNADDIVGTVLIVQSFDDSFAGYADAEKTVVAEPSDEERVANGAQPGAGEVTITLDRQVAAFRFTLLDIEPNEPFKNRDASFVSFACGDKHVTIAFADLVDPASEFFDPSIRFGDGSANRFPTITASELGLPGIDQVVINLGGSGAVGGLSYIEEQPDDVGFASEKMFEGEGGSPFHAVWQAASQGDEYDYETPGGPGGPGGPSPKPGPRDPNDPAPPPVAPSPAAGIAGGLLISLLMTRRPRRDPNKVV